MISLIVDNRATPTAGRRREGLNLHARSGNGSRGSQGGASRKAATRSFFLTTSISQANILIDQTFHARLADFGLLSTLSDLSTSNSSAKGGTARWMSPELLDPEIQSPRRTKCSDCYALGMVIYEVLSGHVPFTQYSRYAAVTKVLRGERPERPQGAEGNWLVGEMWEVLQSCWAPQPGDRPDIKDVLQCLEKASRSWVPPSPRLLVVQSTADPLTQGYTDITTVMSRDGSGVSPSTQESAKPDLKESAGIVNGVGWARFLDELWY